MHFLCNSISYSKIVLTNANYLGIQNQNAEIFLQFHILPVNIHQSQRDQSVRYQDI